MQEKAGNARGRNKHNYFNYKYIFKLFLDFINLNIRFVYLQDSLFFIYLFNCKVELILENNDKEQLRPLGWFYFVY